MKHSVLFLTLLFCLNLGFSQNNKVNYDLDSRWFFGIGGGAAWHTTNVKTKIKFGFTAELGYTFFMKPESPISLDLGIRYLTGLYEGQDYSQSFGIQNNLALNGVQDTNTNYLNYPGYGVLNFRSNVHDLSLELQLNTNRLRERTGWNFFIFGSAGLSIYRTLGNLTYKDINTGNEFKYDYDSLNVTGNLNKVGIKGMLDNDWESALEGSSLSRMNVRFTPSVGLGFSYQVAPRIAIGLEHRTTFTLTHLFDGHQYEEDNTRSSFMDLYHYTGAFVRFHLRRSKKRHPDKENSLNNINNFTPNPIKPEVDIFDPADNPYTTDFNVFTIKAVILNISDASQVTFKQNGSVNNNFTYDPATNRFESTVTLQPGQNVFEVRATNSAGSDAENRIIILESPDSVVKSPPIVNFNNPSYSPYTTSSGIFQLSASVLNVDDPNNIKVEMNGQELTGFNFNATTDILTISLNLNGGPNTVTVTGTNDVGSDSKSTVIVYEVVELLQPPVVTFINPGLNPFTTANDDINIVATVLNVDTKNDVGVKVNGQITSNFTFDGATHTVNLNMNLNDGSNVIEISGTNTAGYDSKSTVIIKKQAAAELPPIVNFINPNVNPYTVYNESYNVIARVENVSNSSQIELKINGVATTNFSYVPSSKIMTINSTLVNGANIFEITATNSAGSDSKNTTIILEQINQALPPVVNFTNPSVNPLTVHSSNFNVAGSVLNVDNSNQIQVTVNGNSFTNFNFNSLTKVITFPTNLILGNNVIQITATNTAGSDSKSTVINYKELVQGYPPVVTIFTPSTSPLNVNVNNFLVTAQVTNVDAKSQVQVRRNGLIISPYLYSFNTGTKQLVLNANLTQGNNLFEISGTNQFGSDSKTTMLVYNPIVTPCNKPVINFQDPGTSPFISNTSTYSIKAQLLNVASSNNITLRVNGQIISSFSFNSSTKILTKSVSLNPGSNVIQIDAVNSCGGSTKSTFIVYQQPNDPCFPPTIAPVNPTTNNFSSTSKYITIKASIAHVTNSQNMSITLNGQNVNFNFDNGTKTLISSLTLNTGNNVVVVSANNNCGNAVYTWNIYHSPCTNPSIYMNNPNVTSTNVSNPTYVISSTISNIQNSNNIQFKRNGQNLNFIYNGINNSFSSSVNLVQGANNFELIASNQCGNDTKTFTINFTPIQTIDPPTVDITSPPTSPYNTNTAGMTIKAILDNVASQSDITVMFNGSHVSNYNYNPSSGILTFFATMQTGNNSVSITGVNQAGSDNDQAIIIYTPPVTIDPPQVVFTAPTSSPKLVAGKGYTVKGFVRNVTSSNQVIFKVNGTTITHYQRNFTSGRMEFSLPLKLSNANSVFNIHVTGTNQSGTHSDFRVVEYDLGTNPMGGSGGSSGSGGSGGSGSGGNSGSGNSGGPCGPRFNPGNSEWEFCLITPSGTYNRDDLANNSNFTYSGSASIVYFKPIAGGGDAIVNGQPYSLQNGQYYLFQGNLNVNVSSNHPGSMGHWTICLTSNSTPMHGNGNNRPPSPCATSGGGNGNGGNNNGNNGNNGNSGGSGNKPGNSGGGSKSNDSNRGVKTNSGGVRFNSGGTKTGGSGGTKPTNPTKTSPSGTKSGGSSGGSKTNSGGVKFNTGGTKSGGTKSGGSGGGTTPATGMKIKNG